MSWEKFCEEFDKSIDDCSREGTHKRMNIAFVNGKFPVTVDIYPAGGTMKKFDEMILGAVKEKTGIDLVKEKQ